MQLLTNNVIRLRAPEPEDLEKLYLWENDPALWTLGSTRSPYSRYVLKQHIADAGKDLYDSKQLRFIIELIDTHTAIGTIDLYDFDPHHHRAGVGLLIDTGYQRQGYAKSALYLLTDYVFSFLKLHQLYAHIPVTNTPSLHLYQQCGFEKMGLLKDWLSSTYGYTDALLVALINKR